MREAHTLKNAEYLAIADAYILQTEEEDFGEDWLDSYATTEILGAKYDKADLEEVVRNQTYLNRNQQEDLHGLFEQHKKLFDGTLGVYPHKKLHIDHVPIQYRMFIWRRSKKSCNT